jgi:hypothetical protein
MMVYTYHLSISHNDLIGDDINLKDIDENYVYEGREVIMNNGNKDILNVLK